jgi:hypothetical protein
VRLKNPSRFESDSHLLVVHNARTGNYRSMAGATTAEAGEITASHISNAANLNAAGPYAEASTQPTIAYKKTYRIRGIPFEYRIRQLQELLRSVLRLDGTRSPIQIRSMAISSNRKTKIATVNFKIPPACLLSNRNEWSFEIPNANGSDAENDNDDNDDIIPQASTITIDTHFNGITILRSFQNVSEHKIE